MIAYINGTFSTIQCVCVCVCVSIGWVYASVWHVSECGWGLVRLRACCSTSMIITAVYCHMGWWCCRWWVGVQATVPRYTHTHTHTQLTPPLSTHCNNVPLLLHTSTHTWSEDTHTRSFIKHIKPCMNAHMSFVLTSWSLCVCYIWGHNFPGDRKYVHIV